MAAPTSGFFEQWVAARNRVLSSPRFHRLAAATPLSRWIARRRSRQLFDLVAGFVYSQITAAFVQLDMPQFLRRGAQDIAAIAEKAGLDIAAADRLMRAAAALGLAQRIGPQRWALGEAGAALSGTRGVAEMIAHHRALYGDLADPVALLRRGGGGGALSGYWPYAEGHHPADSDVAGTYSALMAASQPMVAEQVLDAWNFDRHQCLMDVGGGEGAFLEAVGARCSRVRRMLFDLPPVAARARQRLGPSVAVHGGSFRDDSLPAGADIISLVRVLHDHDDDVVMQILRRTHAALPADGTLLIAEPMARTPGAEPAGDAYFGLYLWAMGTGRPRAPDELRAMLDAAGYRAIRTVPTRLPLVASVIVARKNESSVRNG